ncbi:hypothetical protein [Falsiroseomonas stagni]|uniref:Uncharacterized protein n=1 Tax=Falsiroseomonas stagni DSM 19981 TaxID=1123062 RepID=A0A1I4FBR4_9PROT|nr:hypothetical protein [Falsiroseomonas stagni]SFL13831.1 hypothetical protein SAMN02745775_1256 [Falsiroseomonas stagni DSM 19981]
MSEFNRFPNFEWLMANADSRYPRLPSSDKQVASILGFHAAQVSRMRRGDRSLSTREVERLINECGLMEMHPEFQATWFDWPLHQFVTQMQAISFGRWKGDQPLDGLSALLAALPNARLVEEHDLTQLTSRALQRGDLGPDIAMDLVSKGSIPTGARLGIQLREPGPDMARQVVNRTTTCLLLYRPVRDPFFKAAPCAQRGCLHLLDQSWEPITNYPVPPRMWSQMVIIVAPETRDERRPYGFAVSNVPERLELLLAVFGQAIPPLQTWSEQGGEGLPEQRESLRKHLAEPITKERPRIAGRMLIDVVPPLQPARK